MPVPHNHEANRITELFVQFRESCMSNSLMVEYVSISHWGMFEV